MTGALAEPRGKVFLVGAGPGAPGLLTLRGRAVLGEADVVVFDALANQSLLRYTPVHCEWIDAGKRAGRHTLRQEEICALLVEKAAEGRRVVRLKGGDPFLFGRGGEEAEALRAAGIPYEVVPGVSSAYAVPAYAGVPLTRRGAASSVHIFTAQGAADAESERREWVEAARLNGTLVFLMGFSRIGEIARTLIDGGIAPSTPVAVVQWGTTVHQRQVFSVLERAREDVERAGLTSPVVLVIGQTAAENARLRWTDELPFFGRSIAFTRDLRRAVPWLEALEGLGARVFDFPLVQTSPLEPTEGIAAQLGAVAQNDWIVFTNSLSVEIFFDWLKRHGHDARSLAGVKFAVVGPETAQTLLDCGVRADLIPEKMSQEGLAEELPIRAGGMVLLPGSPRMRPTLKQAIEAAGGQATLMPLYESRIVDSARDELIAALEAHELDALVFVAPQAPQMLAEVRPDLGALFAGVQIICLGSQAARVLEQHRRPADTTLDHPTLDELVESLRKGLAQE